jgi:two-component system sensor histidine kinase MprB
MTLRTRIAAVASLSVALAVLGVAVGVYVAVRADLRGQIDSSLRQRAQGLLGAGPQGPGAPSPAGPPRGATGGRSLPGEVAVPPRRAGASPSVAGPATASRSGSGSGSRLGSRSSGPSSRPGSRSSGPSLRPGSRSGSDPGPNPPPDGDGDDGFPGRIQPPPYGAAPGYVQFIAPRGAVSIPGGQGASKQIAPSARDLQVAAAGAGEVLSDRTIRGTRLRVLTAGAAARGAVLVALPLTEVDRELGRLELLLVAIGLAGIALAAALGVLVARTALAPIAHFTRRTERLSGGLDLSQRLEVSGRDELARLAESFNATLDALARSVGVQRQLIADAGHELRTPIASLRANIQVLQEAGRLSAEERESLRRDVLQELDELTALIGDVIELARGAAAEGARDEVRLDALVRAALERTRRRAAEVHFELDLEPTLIEGDGPALDRAISNLLENARKWSPPRGLVEVRLRAGELSVRDRGPGFAERDLPFVFDRFYRAEDARKLPGSGLGLAIVRQAAEAHGGYARAENAPGGGALLRVHFGSPLAQETAAPVDQ